ncbi:MAG: oxalate:formate antiporter [Deltaproteobacteria bacterium HGW-Deltaproteobacteria-22]|jgi:MFS family permease|nr:MAG: oxalate:formate antiporter [Deltaproteobacteria bacterium HGW-Deltaproteobacteria-22]
MTENVRKILSDSKAARWTALLIVSFTMFAGYYLADVMAPLQGLVQNQLSWSATEYGFFTSAYGWFNVFLFLLIIGGIILDKFGIRVTGIGAALIMVAGTSLKYYAISTSSLDGIDVTLPILGTWKAQVMLAALGYAIFGVGVEITGITASKAIVKWFKGREMALAMGMQLSVARLGTALALSTSLPIARMSGHVSTPLLFCLIMLCIGVLAFSVYAMMDRKLDASIVAARAQSDDQTPEDEKFKLSDIFNILGNRGWWYIALLCVLFYSAVFPFLKYATDLMIQKFGVNANWAGSLPGLLPFGTIFFTPLFGGIYDKIGKGATIMIIGATIITAVHLLFAVPLLNHWSIAIVLMMLLGIGFSLVPSAMWPSVPKIIPDRQLGTAFSLIFWVQNWGLMGVPALIGWVLDKYCITGTKIVDGQPVHTYNYTIPMLIFMSFGLLAIGLGFLLKLEDKKKGYGLQLPNIKKAPTENAQA